MSWLNLRYQNIALLLDNQGVICHVHLLWPLSLSKRCMAPLGGAVILFGFFSKS